MAVREVAEFLGCSKFTVYGLIKHGEFPGFRLGGNWRFRRSDIDKWIAQRHEQSRFQSRGRRRASPSSATAAGQSDGYVSLRSSRLGWAIAELGKFVRAQPKAEDPPRQVECLEIRIARYAQMCIQPLLSASPAGGKHRYPVSL